MCPRLVRQSPCRRYTPESIFDAALKSYKKKTKKDLKRHDLFKQLEKCDSPAAILAVFQVDDFRRIRTGDDDRLKKKRFLPVVNVLYSFSATLSEGVGLIFSPSKVVFAGVGVLLLAAKDVATSQDIVGDIFGRIESFFGRLEVYTKIPLTPAMTDKIVQITVEILSILATATKEMKQTRAKRFVKRIAGKADLEDGLEKLDTLTNEEVVTANAQLLKITHNIDNKVAGVSDGVRGVDENVQDMNDRVKAIDEMIQTTADGGKIVFS
ncbi:hypothetical protein EDB87DRAFT_1822624 [Lactarius vividus]|nr:hypothetical protein EDB87DRAFT_1822624 [Lactarius vividus]